MMEPNSMASVVAIGVTSILALLLLVVVPVYLGTSYARRERELAHAERIKALELGRPLPGDEPREPWLSPARVCVALGVGVPIGAFLIAWAASSDLPVSAAYAIWPSAGAVGMTAVIGGTLLAARLPSGPRPAENPLNSHAKPSHDPDAFDVVGRRG